MTRALISLILVALAGTSLATERLIYSNRSLYRDIKVTEDGNMRCMKFASREFLTSRQSCVYLDDPDKLVFDYAQSVFAGLLYNPEPKRVLVLGLGGGTLPMVFARILPQAEITSVEIDPAVVDVARAYFGYETDERSTVVEQDGRVFVRRANLKGERYDWIVLDAFNGDYIPEHLMTKEFLEECGALLSDGGVLTANTFATSSLYDHETATYAAAFEWFVHIRRVLGNRIIVTANGPAPEKSVLRERARALRDVLSPFDVDIVQVAREIRTPRDWETTARVLTDQYSPANLLQRQ